MDDDKHSIEIFGSRVALWKALVWIVISTVMGSAAIWKWAWVDELLRALSMMP
jgi:hypothetical protein